MQAGLGGAATIAAAPLLILEASGLSSNSCTPPRSSARGAWRSRRAPRSRRSQPVSWSARAPAPRARQVAKASVPGPRPARSRATPCRARSLGCRTAACSVGRAAARPAPARRQRLRRVVLHDAGVVHSNGNEPSSSSAHLRRAGRLAVACASPGAASTANAHARAAWRSSGTTPPAAGPTGIGRRAVPVTDRTPPTPGHDLADRHARRDRQDHVSGPGSKYSSARLRPPTTVTWLST